MIRKIEMNGEIHSIAGWARIYGHTPNTVRSRMANGWSLQKALETPRFQPPKITIKGQTRTMLGWARRLGIDRRAVWSRLKRNRSDDDFLAGKRQWRYITVFGRTQHLSAWAREVGISKSTIGLRLKAGVPPEVALTAPLREDKRRKNT